MKKTLSWFSLITGLCIIVLSACSSSETYADKLKGERRQIKRFINEQNIEVLSTYPGNKVFEENQYFRDPETGVYIHVIDSGNGHRANAENRSEVSYRFWDTMTLPTAQSDTVSNDNETGRQPITFTYGRTSTYMNASNSTSYEYYYLSPGVTVPLKYVGEGAVVKLIVPFSQGSTYQNQVFKAVYYGRLKYTRITN